MIFFVKKVYYKIKSLIEDFKVKKYLISYKNNKPNDKIKIGFLVQSAEVWDKEVDVYDEMLKRDNIDVFMLVVPAYDFAAKKINAFYKNNYFLQNYSNVIKVMNDAGEIIDIKELKLDYIFYQRPYDDYLPKELRSDEVMKYSRCCYIPYGFSGSDSFNEGNTRRDFFRNMYFVFLESEHMRNVLSAKYKSNLKKGYQHFEYLGYPSLEPYLYLNKSESIKNVLWTPRWSYDPNIGGSHFIEYKDFMVRARDYFPDINLTFRPHPLMFDELVNKNLMTKEEIKQFKKLLEEKKIFLDQGEPIMKAIASSDVMITDFSSIIIMFFLTGKPIIYCESSIEFNETYKKMKKYMYVAHNQEELEYFIGNLIQGNDYLKEGRLKFIEKEFSNNKDAAKNIVNRVCDDYWY